MLYLSKSTHQQAQTLLDTPSEDAFDNFTVLASRLMGVPVSIVSIIDYEGDRQFFKSQCGLDSPWSEARQTPLSHSFCRTVAETNLPLRVTDARLDERVKDNPAVTELNVIAYLGTPIYAADGTPIGSFCAIDSAPREWTESDLDTLKRLGQAITDQIRSRVLLEEMNSLREEMILERDWLASVLETVPVGVLSMNENGEICLANKACCKVLGLTEQELANRRFNDARWRVESLDGRDIPEDELPFPVALRDQKPVRDYRHAIHWPNGSRRVLSVNASPLNSAYQGSAVVLSAQDITDEYAAMMQLEDALHKAEDVSRAKSTFLANMSHEIRTPLNGVLGMAEILENALTDPSKKRMAAIIRQSGETLLSVLNAILDMSKIEAGKLTIEDVPFTLSDILTPIEVLHRVSAEEKGIHLTVLTSRGVGLQRHGDPFRLTQIFNNLLSNAIKFTEAGEVNVVVTSMPGQPVTIDVTDTGVGMTEEQLARAFNSFEQADGSMTRRFGGTGLGLSIVRELVRLMGGDITIDSTAGKGTHVQVTLPLPEIAVEIAPAAAPQDQVARPILQDRRILIADDNQTNRLVLSEMLFETGVALTLCADGQQAVDAWAQALRDGAPFDMILLDITMPVMDGLEALAEIKRREADQGLVPVPAIAVTANATPSQVATYLSCGFDSHIAKPIRQEAFLSVVGAFLNSKN
jgi:PAS domain S-box-containing protein